MKVAVQGFRVYGLGAVGVARSSGGAIHPQPEPLAR